MFISVSSIAALFWNKIARSVNRLDPVILVFVYGKELLDISNHILHNIFGLFLFRNFNDQLNEPVILRLLCMLLAPEFHEITVRPAGSHNFISTTTEHRVQCMQSIILQSP